MADSVYATPPSPDLSDEDATAATLLSTSDLVEPKSPAPPQLSLHQPPALPLFDTTNATMLPPSTTTTTAMDLQSPNHLASTLQQSFLHTPHAFPTSTPNNNEAPPNHLQFIADFSATDLSTPDNSKKRRKQTTPLRVSALGDDPSAEPASVDFQMNPNLDPNIPSQIALATLNELQAKLQSAMAQQFENASNQYPRSGHGQGDNEDDDDTTLENGEIQPQRLYPNNLDCDQCPAQFDSEIKLGLHVLQAHAPKPVPEDTPSNEHNFQIRVKRELRWDAEEEYQKPDSNDDAQPAQPDNKWMPLAGLPFPFSAEAAAMLSASGYLGQMPQMMAGLPGFGSAGADGMARPSIPPIRIFNPEAYCDLCNKEFCNKYFLKTHKANKHNIYEPNTTANGGDSNGPSNNQLSHMSQMFHLQQQQQHQQQMQQIQQQIQQQKQDPNLPNLLQSFNSHIAIPASLPHSTPLAPQVDQTVPCDVCHRRFSNAASMRRHRAKAHDQSQQQQQPPQASQSEQADIKPVTSSNPKFTVPEGFCEDFTVEQEDTSFTPQIRKLSPASMQLARDSNFSNDKLRRLGVINPEAFCEICCKEYCNKYFLRTHKLKRHGIFMPMEGDPQQQQQQQQQLLMQQQQQMQQQVLGNFDQDETKKWLQFVQTAPLNLMMASQPMKRSLEKAMDMSDAMATDPDAGDDQSSSSDAKRPRNTDSPPKADDQQQPHQSARSSPVASNDQQEEAISVDLQKLQSMIMQLNDLSAKRPATCTICGKEMENQYVLHAHMVAEHTTPGDNNNGIKMSPTTSSPPPLPPPPSQMAQPKSEFACKMCDKELPSEFALRHHTFEVHGIATPNHSISPPFALQQFARKIPERSADGMPGMGKIGVAAERRPYTITPTSSYCEICNKELCNKYFMKTHMQRMHGIEIENGAQIGGVICNICNKELCSKYFLRVHKHNTHGIVDEGSPMAIQQAKRENVESTSNDHTMHNRNSPPMDLKPGEISELGNRYFTHFSEVCPLCNRRFRGSKWLRTHLMADHGKLGTDKLREIEQNLGLVKQESPTLRIPNGSFGFADALTLKHKHAISNLFAGPGDEQNTSFANKPKEYNCSYCPFTTPSYAFLFIHERSHSLMGFVNDSESAVSLAKEETAPQKPSTPAMPSTESPFDRHASHNFNPTVSGSPPPRPTSTTPQEAATVGDPAQKSPTPSSTATAQMLNELANATKRPAAYALPTADDNSPMVMQSFLMEEIVQHESNGGASSPNGYDSGVNRFVPSIVYLPVKQRFPDKLVVSFTLTPA